MKSPNKSLGQQDPFVDLEAAKLAIDSFEGDAGEFELAISDELNDPIGMNMAILTDAIMMKGWEPDGFEAKPGYRVFKYKASEQV